MPTQGPIQADAQQAARIIHARTGESLDFSRELARHMERRLLVAIQYAERVSGPTAAQIVAEAVYQHEVRLAAQRRDRTLERAKAGHMEQRQRAVTRARAA